MSMNLLFCPLQLTPLLQKHFFPLKFYSVDLHCSAWWESQSIGALLRADLPNATVDDACNGYGKPVGRVDIFCCTSGVHFPFYFYLILWLITSVLKGVYFVHMLGDIFLSSWRASARRYSVFGINRQVILYCVRAESKRRRYMCCSNMSSVTTFFPDARITVALLDIVSI